MSLLRELSRLKALRPLDDALAAWVSGVSGVATKREAASCAIHASACGQATSASTSRRGLAGSKPA